MVEAAYILGRITLVLAFIAWIIEWWAALRADRPRWWAYAPTGIWLATIVGFYTVRLVLCDVRCPSELAAPLNAWSSAIRIWGIITATGLTILHLRHGWPRANDGRR